MRRLLIAIRSRALTNMLTQDLSSRFEVHSCSTGTDAGELIEKLRPDALIIYLQLPERNGLSVLERCSYRPPAVIAITDFVDEDVVRRAKASGVTVLIRIPCTTRCIVQHLERVTEKTPSPGR